MSKNLKVRIKDLIKAIGTLIGRGIRATLDAVKDYFYGERKVQSTDTEDKAKLKRSLSASIARSVYLKNVKITGNVYVVINGSRPSHRRGKRATSGRNPVRRGHRHNPQKKQRSSGKKGSKRCRRGKKRPNKYTNRRGKRYPRQRPKTRKSGRRQPKSRARTRQYRRKSRH